MTPEEKHKNKRFSAYAIMMAGVLLLILGCAVVPSVFLVVPGLLILLGGFLYKSVADRRYREEVSRITETPEIDFSAMKQRRGDEPSEQ